MTDGQDYFAILFDILCNVWERLGRNCRETRPQGFLYFSKETMAPPKVVEVSFAENYAVLSMKNGENRIDMEFLKQFNSALDEIERYYLFSVVVVKL